MQNKKILFIVLGLLAVLLLGGGGWYYTTQMTADQTSDLPEDEQMMADDQMDDDADQMVAEDNNSFMQPTESNNGVVANIQIKSPDIQAFVFSNEVSGLGATLVNHQSQFRSTDKELWLTIRLAANSQVENAKFSIIYKKDSSILGPANTVIKNEGGVNLGVFKISSPPQGWPVGDYVGVIALPNGEATKFDFRVN